MKALDNSIKVMVDNLNQILKDNILSIYLYGSYTLNDFKLGWSDIDILVLTKRELDLVVAEKLLYLRQDLLKSEPRNKFYRSFEGAILSFDGFLTHKKENVVYWGTKGEKIRDCYVLDSFSMKQLVNNSKLIFGTDVRDRFKEPVFQDLLKDVLKHYETIREHARVTGRNVYSFGWFLDISRCIYTLQTGDIISKTEAGKWALKKGLCPDKKVLKSVLKIRGNPSKYLSKKRIMDYAETFGDYVQNYADVLYFYIKEHKAQFSVQ